ncbi:MAG: hypothetical protein Q9168_001077 [Polycauliona sp. 1 TL-2023]
MSIPSTNQLPHFSPYRANEIATSSNKKTLTPLNVLDALSQCEYEDFLPRVKAELEKFNEIATGKRNEYRRKIKEKETGVVDPNEKKRDVAVNGNGDAAANGGIGMVGGEGGEDDDDGGEERARKRVRREEVAEGSEKGQGPGQLMTTASAGATPEEDEEDRYDTAMEDEGTGVNGGEAAQDDDTELSDDEVEEDEREISQVDMDTGLDAQPDGPSSGVDEDEEDESD